MEIKNKKMKNSDKTAKSTAVQKKTYVISYHIVSFK